MDSRKGGNYINLKFNILQRQNVAISLESDIEEDQERLKSQNWREGEEKEEEKEGCEITRI